MGNNTSRPGTYARNAHGGATMGGVHYSYPTGAARMGGVQPKARPRNRAAPSTRTQSQQQPSQPYSNIAEGQRDRLRGSDNGDTTPPPPPYAPPPSTNQAIEQTTARLAAPSEMRPPPAYMNRPLASRQDLGRWISV